MKITYLGHSSLQIESNHKKLIVDPFISGNPLAKDIDVHSLEADYVLLTHAHYDHIHDVEAIVNRTGAEIISNHEVAVYYTNKNKEYKAHGMNQGGTWEYDFGKLSVVNAIHSSSFPDGTYGGNPVGFILESEGKSVYISGDTDLTMDMKLIPMFHQLDLAILSVGGYFTMDIDRSLVAAQFVKCDRVLGVHIDTAPFIQIDHEAAKNKFKEAGKELILLNIGAALEL